MKKITEQMIMSYEKRLIDDEKAVSTIRKYMRELRRFAAWCQGGKVDKRVVLKYKAHLNKSHSPTGVNTILSTLNCFFSVMEWHELKTKSIKIQRCVFIDSKQELSKAEYYKLLTTARDKGKKRLYYLMQTMCACGIRVSEVQYITAEAVECGIAEINCKGKRRQVFLPHDLCKMLKEYMLEKGLTGGPVFVTLRGKPLDRSNIWGEMQALCREAKIPAEKVHPHNLRHLFARTYYSAQKDIVRLADILGHSSINTTRIYTMESGETHKRQIQGLGLLDENE